MRLNLSENQKLKIIALIGAILLWIFVINEGFRVDFLEKDIPIQVYNLSDDLVVVNDLGKVKLKVRAPTNLWQKFPEKDLEAFVDLKNFRQGSYSVEVKVSSVNPKVQILDKKPSKVQVIIEPQFTIKKKINLEIEGSVGEGYIAKDPILSQKEVEIKGAKSALDNINKLVAKVELNGEKAEVKKQVELKVFDQNNNPIQNIEINPKTVEITIPVEKETEIKTVGIKTNIVGNPANGFLFEKAIAEPSFASISGNKESLKEIEFLETKEININGLDKYKETKIGFNLPPGITLVEPSEVLVKIYISPITTAKSVEAKINFKNLGQNFEVTSYTPSVALITIEGDSNILNSLKKDSIIVNLDLLGKGEGTYTFPLKSEMFQIPEGVKIKSIDTKEIKVIIREKIPL